MVYLSLSSKGVFGKSLKNRNLSSLGFLTGGIRVKQIQLISARLVVETALIKKVRVRIIMTLFEACEQTCFKENTDVIVFIRTTVNLNFPTPILANKSPLKWQLTSSKEKGDSSKWGRAQWWALQS